jgi:hypothetical protein
MAGVSGVDHQLVARRPSMILQDALDARYGVCYVGVIDHAGGYTAQDAINGTDHFGVPLSVITPANVNVFNHGLNDQYAYSAAVYALDLASFAAYSAAAGGKTIFETAAMSIGPDYTAAMHSVASAHGVRLADLNAYAATVPSLNGYFPDATHGTQDWYVLEVVNVLAPAVFASVDEVVAALP